MTINSKGFSDGSDGKESACNERPGFKPWVWKIPWGMAWQPTLVFFAWRIPWTEELDRLQSMGSRVLAMTERLSTHSHKF